MARRGLEAAIGLLLTLGTAFVLVRYGKPSDFGGPTTLVQARFERVDGLRVGGEVRINGVRVGLISDISLDALTYAAVVTMRVEKTIFLAKDTSARVEGGSLLGSRVLSLCPGASEEPLGSEPIRNTTPPMNFEDLIGQVATRVFSKEGSQK